MKAIYIAIKMFWKQKFIIFWLIISVALSLNYLCPILGQYIYYKSYVKSIEMLNIDNACYLYCNPFYSRKGGEFKKIVDEEIDNMENVISRAELYSLYNEDLSCTMLMYNEVLIDKFKPNLLEGSWFGEGLEKENIPIVISEDLNYRVKDIISIPFYINNKPQKINCEIVGILNPTVKIPTFSSAADDEYFTSDALLSDIESIIIIPFISDVKTMLLADDYMFKANGSILYTKTGITTEEIRNKLGFAGVITDLDAGSARFYQQTKLVVFSMGIYFLLYFMIIQICFSCMNKIMNNKIKKIYGIYLLTGMSLKIYYYIEIMRLFLLMFLGVVISYISLMKSGIIFVYFPHISNISVYSLILLYMSLIFVPPFIWELFNNKKEDIKTYVVEMKVKL